MASQQSRAYVSLQAPSATCSQQSLARASSAPNISRDSAPQKVEPGGPNEGPSWHYRYDRRLANFSKCVSSLRSSVDGRWLLGGSSSSDIRLWDSQSWAEAARLKGNRREEPRCVAVSPDGRWLASVQPGVLLVFCGEAPWSIVLAMPSRIDPNTEKATDWCCASFSPAPPQQQDVEEAMPSTDVIQGSFLAVLSTTHIFVFDYAYGWTPELMLQRSHSLLRFATPSSVAYSPCGGWVLCGNAEGQLQMWNVQGGLELTAKLSAHLGRLNCITFSPNESDYEPRAVSCGADMSLCVWRRGSDSWHREFKILDPHNGCDGISCCAFSANGSALISVGKELCIWRVSCPSAGSRIQFRIHQRLPAIGSCDGLSSGAFCGRDHIAVGAQDGSVGVWRCCPGLPPGPPPALPEEREGSVALDDCQPTAVLASTPALLAEEARTRLEAPRPPKPMKRVAEVSPSTSEVGEAVVPRFGSGHATRSNEVKGWSKKTMVRPIARSLPDLAIAAVEAGGQATFPAHSPPGNMHSSPSQPTTVRTWHRSPSPSGRRSALLASAGAGSLPTAGNTLIASMDTDREHATEALMPTSARGTWMPGASAASLLPSGRMNSHIKRASSAHRRPPMSTSVPVSARAARNWEAVKINAGG
eukprot:TRINITY_DN61006_c0_g1_i1.p1 TRINITY_DN61006_c0_g1~~TRINITY_DN61006_c0_g1_i1.p1  ORF type:complete len:643 (+),score=70.99 TRINITY_DN61006_c0_g1_i1:151-2079(+)